MRTCALQARVGLQAEAAFLGWRLGEMLETRGSAPYCELDEARFGLGPAEMLRAPTGQLPAAEAPTRTRNADGGLRA